MRIVYFTGLHTMLNKNVFGCRPYVCEYWVYPDISVHFFLSNEKRVRCYLNNF